MKKLLLGLGTLSIAILPIAAIASCSSTPSPAPTLEMEVAKFNKSLKSKDGTLTTSSVVNDFNKESSQPTKLELLKKLIDVPSLSTGFDLEIGLASVNQTNNSSVDVLVTVKEISTSKSEVATLIITDLVAIAATLETEAAKFNAPTKTTKPLIMASEAVQAIADASGAEAKLKALEAFANVPKLDDTFELEVKSAAVGSPTTTNADVKITIKEKTTPANTKEVILVVTDFSVTSITAEAAKFVPTPTKSNSASSADAAKTINDAQGSENKKASLKFFATSIPDLSSHFDYVVKSASPSTNVDTSLDVIITVNRISTADSSTIIESKDTTFIITGFTSTIPLATEAAKFAAPTRTQTTNSTAKSATDTMNAIAQPNKKSTL